MCRHSLNLARNYIDQTRRRKGLWVEEKLVEKADKQRMEQELRERERMMEKRRAKQIARFERGSEMDDQSEKSSLVSEKAYF